MKHKNRSTDGKNTVTTVVLSRDEAEKLIKGLFKHNSIKPTFISDYEKRQRGFDFLINKLRDWSKQTNTTENDILIQSQNDLYPLPFRCNGVQINNAIKVETKDKTYDGYTYSSSVIYIFNGNTKTRMGETHEVSIHYKPRLDVQFIPTDVCGDVSKGVKNVVYKCLFLKNSYNLKVVVDNNII